MQGYYVQSTIEFLSVFCADNWLIYNNYNLPPTQVQIKLENTPWLVLSVDLQLLPQVKLFQLLL